MTTYNTYRMDKLVRNGALNNMKEHGTLVDWETLNNQAVATTLLKEKLPEELTEMQAAVGLNNFIEELADVYEVLDEICRRKGISPEILAAAKKHKRERRGDFSGGYYVSTIHCPVGSKWDTYCAKDPAKYVPAGQVEHP